MVPWQRETPAEGPKIRNWSPERNAHRHSSLTLLTSPGFSLTILIIADTAPSFWTSSRPGAFGSGASPSPSCPWKLPASMLFPRMGLAAPLNTGIWYRKDSTPCEPYKHNTWVKAQLIRGISDRVLLICNVHVMSEVWPTNAIQSIWTIPWTFLWDVMRLHLPTLKLWTTDGLLIS